MPDAHATENGTAGAVKRDDAHANGNGDATAREDACVTLPLSVRAIVWLERKLDERFGAS